MGKRGWKRAWIFACLKKKSCYNCKGEQIDKFLWPCIRGERPSAFGLSEPASGADPSMLQTPATPDGDFFVINGTKMFPTFADVADFVQLFARLPGTRGGRA